jgi:hypothetical protein
VGTCRDLKRKKKNGVGLKRRTLIFPIYTQPLSVPTSNSKLYFWIFLGFKTSWFGLSLVNSHFKPPRNPRWTCLCLKPAIWINGGCRDKSVIKFSAAYEPLRKLMLKMGGFWLEVFMPIYKANLIGQWELHKHQVKNHHLGPWGLDLLETSRCTTVFKAETTGVFIEKHV